MSPSYLIAARFINVTANILETVLTIYMYIIIARAIISWFRLDPYNPLVRALYNLTEPVLSRIRRRIPPLGGIDFSPLIVVLVIFFFIQFGIYSLRIVANNLSNPLNGA